MTETSSPLTAETRLVPPEIPGITAGIPNPASVYLASLAPGSRRTMEQALREIARFLYGGAADKESVLLSPDPTVVPWERLRYVHTQALRARLAERYAPTTASKMLCALRGTLKAAWRLGLLPAEEYRRAVDVAGVTGETLPAGRSLTGAEVAGLMQVCARDPNRALGARDCALIGLLYGCGLRRAEAVGLSLSSWDSEGSVLRVLGKRSKTRLVPVVGGAERALRDWLVWRGDLPGPLLLPVRKNGKIGPTTPEVPDSGRPRKPRPPRHLTPQAAYFALQERANQAGIAHFSPHDFRRTFVGDLLDRGADIVTVQKLAGHANVTTTARYDRRGEAVKRRAAALLEVPYAGNATDAHTAADAAG